MTEPEVIAEPAATTAEPAMPGPPRPRFWRRSRVFALVGLLVLIAAGVLSATVKVGYVAISPGSLYETEELVSIEGTRSYPADGELLYATVNLREVVFWDWLFAKLDDDTVLRRTEDVFGDRDRSDNRQVNFQLMDTSKTVATALALTRAGLLDHEPGAVVTLVRPNTPAATAGLVAGELIHTIDGRLVAAPDDVATMLEAARGSTLTIETENGLGTRREVRLAVPGSGAIGFDLVPLAGPRSSGALVAGLLEGEPAADVLEFGDVIVAVDEVPVLTTRDAIRQVNTHDPGDTIALRVRDAEGNERDATLVLGERPDDPRTPDDESGGPFMGIEMRPAYELPDDIQVEIDSGDVGGPSAGLAYTLATLDLLTPGELTGGARVAATGEILDDGTVRIVGGVAQKTLAAIDDGIEVFLMPTADIADAESVAGDDIRVIGVDTLDDALDALAELGGNAGDYVEARETLSV